MTGLLSAIKELWSVWRTLVADLGLLAGTAAFVFVCVFLHASLQADGLPDLDESPKRSLEPVEKIVFAFPEVSDE